MTATAQSNWIDRVHRSAHLCLTVGLVIHKAFYRVTKKRSGVGRFCLTSGVWQLVAALNPDSSESITAVPQSTNTVVTGVVLVAVASVCKRHLLLLFSVCRFVILCFSSRLIAVVVPPLPPLLLLPQPLVFCFLFFSSSDFPFLALILCVAISAHCGDLVMVRRRPCMGTLLNRQARANSA